MALRYSAQVGNTLRKYGLRYEDLYDPLLNQVNAITHCAIAMEHDLQVRVHNVLI